MPETIRFGQSLISQNGPCYVIAEIGHNHQGRLDIAKEMIRTAANCGADAVKFQKRNNRKLFTRQMYDSPYNSENSYGSTYGEHRERLEFDWDEYIELKKCAEEEQIEFLCTPFDEDSLEFLEALNVPAYKLASGDLTNIPLMSKMARLKKPLFLSTGASNFEEVRLAYETVRNFHDQICLMHCVSEYPTEYENLNLNVIKLLKREFPEAIIGFSSHDNGILAPSIAYSMGATVLEKHFTLNHAWKGTDHAFSLQPEGLRKQIRDLQRMDVMFGSEEKALRDYEKGARQKMGKSLYLTRTLPAGHALNKEDLTCKSPGDGLAPYLLNLILGKKLKKTLPAETKLQYGDLLLDEEEKSALQNESDITLSNFSS